ncbi:MAG: FkbM family methyltransferase [Nitrosopumilaceae archaeon]|nr:FkbM family methyltransferase [Nitrosopumilaceae archaeon]
MNENTTKIHGVDLITHNDMVVHAYNKHGAFEPETFEMFETMINNTASVKTPIFADIGAYTGIYSLYAAQRGCDVHAFEPNPYVYKRLLKNITEHPNGGYINAHKCAISIANGYADFYVNPNVLLTSGGSLESDIKPNKEKVRVQVEEYDGTFPIPDIIKMDVEGHEIKALEGMIETIQFGKPCIIIESNSVEHTQKLVDWFSEIDYELKHRCDGRNLVFGS